MGAEARDIGVGRWCGAMAWDSGVGRWCEAPRPSLPTPIPTCLRSMVRIWSSVEMVGDSPPCTQKILLSMTADRLRMHAEAGLGNELICEGGEEELTPTEQRGGQGSAPVVHAASTLSSHRVKWAHLR